MLYICHFYDSRELTLGHEEVVKAMSSMAKVATLCPPTVPVITIYVYIIQIQLILVSAIFFSFIFPPK